MDEKVTVFTYVKQVLKVYGLTVLIFIIFNQVIGDKAMGHSSLFSMGKGALSIATLLQLLAFIVCEVGLDFLVLKSRILNIASVALRKLIFLVLTVFAVAGYAVILRWFPVDDIHAWAGFCISFAICLLFGFLFSWLEEKSENKKMAGALDKMKHMD